VVRVVIGALFQGWRLAIRRRLPSELDRCRRSEVVHRSSGEQGPSVDDGSGDGCQGDGIV
jgi:hypothetical protein